MIKKTIVQDILNSFITEDSVVNIYSPQNVEVKNVQGTDEQNPASEVPQETDLQNDQDYYEDEPEGINVPEGVPEQQETLPDEQMVPNQEIQGQSQEDYYEDEPQVDQGQQASEEFSFPQQQEDMQNYQQAPQEVPVQPYPNQIQPNQQVPLADINQQIPQDPNAQMQAPSIDPGQQPPVDPNQMIGQPLPQGPAPIDPNVQTGAPIPGGPVPMGPPPTDPSQIPLMNVAPTDIGKMELMKSINNKLVELKDVLDKFSSKNYEHVKEKIMEAIKMFNLVILNLPTFRENLQDIADKYKDLIKTAVVEIQKIRIKEKKELENI